MISRVWHVAQPMLVEERAAVLRIRGRRARQVSRRRLGRPHEQREELDVHAFVVRRSDRRGTVSNAATELPFEVGSSGSSGLVMPISFT